MFNFLFDKINKSTFHIRIYSNFRSIEKRIVFVFCSLIIAGCHFQNQTSVRDDVLVYCSEGSPETFNPQLSTSGVTFDASSRTLYNRLVEFSPGTTNLQPALATHWEISKDGREYTFYLRKNVHFHTTNQFKPSRSFNADDVLFSFHKQWLKDHPFYLDSNDENSLNYRYFKSMGLGNLIENISKLNSHTVRFKLSRAESPFLATLAMDFASILSAEYAQQALRMGDTHLINREPVGTGPFQLVRYQPDAFIRYKAHPDYWQGKQKFNNLVFAITPDPSLRFARVIASECDVMANPLPIHIKSASQFNNAKVLSDAGLNVAFLSMNTLKPPFDKVLVRQAINHAINKQSIIKAVYQETATPAITVVPPNMWAHDSLIDDQLYDLEKARQLLVQAGYPDGFEMNIWTMSAQRAYNPNAKKMAELIQQNLAQIGITVEITTFEYGTFLNKVRTGQHQTALMGWIGDNGDPDNFFSNLLSCAGTISGTNSAFWCHSWFNQLINQAREQSEIKVRKKLYSRAQKIFKQFSPWVPIAHATQHLIINPRVKNLMIMPTGGINFNGVYLQPELGDDND